MPVGRPKGSWTEGSLRHRIRERLSDGKPMTPSELAAVLHEDVDRVRNALTCGCADRAFRSIIVRGKEARYIPWGFDVEVRLVPIDPRQYIGQARQWWTV
jgi:hypothetical protein